MVGPSDRVAWGRRTAPRATRAARHAPRRRSGNDPLTLWNASDPVSGAAGIPRNMSTIPSKLAGVGYGTVQAGKWHVGLATADHTPHGRGYAKVCWSDASAGVRA